MATDFTLIPLAIDFESAPALAKGTGGIEECIDGIIDLIVFTPKGSFKADPDFGFEYWSHEFSNLNVREFNNNYLGLMSDVKSLNDINRKQCEASLKESIEAYEPRLHNPEVKVELDLNVKSADLRLKSKYEMRITVTGSIDDGLGVSRHYEKRIAFMVEPVARKMTI